MSVPNVLKIGTGLQPEVSSQKLFQRHPVEKKSCASIPNGWTHMECYKNNAGAYCSTFFSMANLPL